MEMPANTLVLSVSELNHEARQALENALPPLWVEGEISNFVHHSSGHMYFDLKDDRAQVRCAMFRGANRQLGFRPASGQQALVQGRVTLYEPRGSYQLVIEHMEPAGEGLLRRRLEALKARLAAEGLFDPAHKRPLPILPRCVGIVTSPTGAAVRDILKVLRRRFPAVPVVLYPVQVQGERARKEIAAAIELAGERGDCDVLIVGRGGGSLEDLWAFNEEVVVRAIHACPLPVVSAVGHETDFTLADLVADLRAPTPSAAAEQVVPDGQAWLAQTRSWSLRLQRAAQRLLARRRQELEQLNGRLSRRHPGFILEQHAQRLDELTLRSRRAMLSQLARARTRSGHLQIRLGRAAPGNRITATAQQLAGWQLRMLAAVRRRLADRQRQLAVMAAQLHAVSPLATLERGYALVEDKTSGAILRDAARLAPGQEITTRLARGRFEAVVKKILEP